MELNEIKIDSPTVTADGVENGHGALERKTIDLERDFLRKNMKSSATENTYNDASVGINGKNEEKKATKRSIDEDKQEILEKESFLKETCRKIKALFSKHKEKIVLALKVLLFAAYFVYFGFAVAHHVGDEGSWRLIGCTIFGVLLILWKLFKRCKHYKIYEKWCYNIDVAYSTGKRSLVIRWTLYVAMTLFMVIYVIVFVAIKSPTNLRSLMGLFIFTVGLFLYSNNKRKVNWHTIFWAMSLQFIMALLVLKTYVGVSIIGWCGKRLEEFFDHSKAGSVFLFGENNTDHTFMFGVLPGVIFVVVGTSVVNYLGVVSFIVESVGRVLSFLLGTSPAEGINAIGSIFFFVPGSVMLIQQYLPDMTPSQLFVTYAASFATLGATAIVLYVSFGVSAGALIAASTMSAPAALAAAKLVFPSHDDEVVPISPSSKGGEEKNERPVFLRQATSLMDSILLGISQGAALLMQIATFVFTFLAIIEFLNSTMVWFGDRVGIEGLTLEFLFSYLFYPLAFLMGTREEDCLLIGELLGIRTFSFPTFGYIKLGPIVLNGQEFREYVKASVNNTWEYSGRDVILHNTNKTLIGGVMDARSEIIATYALCGMTSVALMGFVLGVFQKMIPHRAEEVRGNIFRAFIAGTVACCFTACFAGLLYEEDVA